MTVTVTPTGRPLPRPGLPEMVVDVDVSTPSSARLPDGLAVDFDGEVLAIEGPDRDLLVRADGRHVTRLRAGSARVDLSASVSLAEIGGWTPARGAQVEVAVEADRLSGLRHRYEISPNPPAAGQPCTITVRTGDDPVAEVAVVIEGERVDAELAGEGVWQAVVAGRDEGEVVRYSIEVTTSDGEKIAVADAGADFVLPRPDTVFFRPPRTAFSYQVGEPGMPDWLRDGVGYHLLVDRFAGPGGAPVDPASATSLLGFAGGAVSGVTARLDHLVDLGVTWLLVSPLTPGEMHVCYDVKDHTAVEPRLGTEADVRTLCSEAHRRGLRVLLDTEMSYLGMRHPRATDPEWTLQTADGNRLGWLLGNPTFVPVDHFNFDARRHLIDAARWWLDLGFDGFRLDSAHAAPFDFWTDFGAAVRTVRPEAVTIAEATRPTDFCRQFRGRLTGFLDFETQAGLRGLAGDSTWTPTRFAATAEAQAAGPEGLAAVAFFECHDGDRFDLVAGGDRRRLLLATTLLMTLPGPPLLYYGTEIGMTQDEPGEMDLRARQPMPWAANDAELLAATAELVNLRRSSPALRRGSYRTLTADDGSGLFAFERVDLASGDRRVIAANTSDQARSVDLAGCPPTPLAPLSATIMEG